MSQVKKAIEKGNIDGAKIYAQNAIRKKTEALNYLRLASRLDAVVSRLDTQAKMNMINSSMSQIVRALDRVSGMPFQLHGASGPLISMPRCSQRYHACWMCKKQHIRTGENASHQQFRIFSLRRICSSVHVRSDAYILKVYVCTAGPGIQQPGEGRLHHGAVRAPI